MKTIIEDPVFIRMITTIITWVVLYFIVYFIAVQQGIRKDIIKNAYNLSQKITKVSSYFRASVEAGTTIDSKTAIKLLRKIKRYGKESTSILQVYIQEEKENLDVKAAQKRLRSIESECGDVARAYRARHEYDLSKEIEDIIKLSTEASTILKEVIKQREDNKLLKI